jgi:hypothetical protein
VQPVDLPGFYNLLKQAESQDATAAVAATKAITPTGSGGNSEGDPTPDANLATITDSFTLNCTGGLVPSTSQAQNVTVPPDRPWEVSAGSFEFAIKSPIAIKLAAVQQGDPVNSSVDGTGQLIYARPMNLSGQL